MQEPKRYKIVTANGNSSNVIECKDGHWVNFHYYEQLKNKVKELESKEHINGIIKKSITDYLNQNGDKLLFSQRKALNDYLDSL